MSARETSAGLSRRDFFKGLGATAVVAATERVEAVAQELQKANAEKVVGPGTVPITLRINGAEERFDLEPRVTLLDALRNYSHHTGAKEVCDRATCGACTVLLDGTPVYSCMTLAIEAQGRAITTIEGIAREGALNPVQKAFIECDGLQCGYCTPGFVLTLTALLAEKPKPSEEEVKKAIAGHLCRCGSYPHIFDAAKKAAGLEVSARTEVLPHALA